MDVLDPDHMLVVGHGMGIRRSTADVIKPKTVVVSDWLNTGTTRTNHLNPLRKKRILPPSAELSEIAREAAAKWRGPAVLGEMISADVLAERQEDPTIQALVKRYPGFVLYEMEAGGVAEALWNRFGSHRIPGYLVIKGVSDIHDARPNRQPPSLAVRRRARERWRGPASRNAAAFTKALISSWLPLDKRRPTPVARLVPSGLTITQNDRCCGVLHGVLPEHYSQIAQFNVERMLAERMPRTVKTIFTVCAFEPQDLWKVLQESYKRHHNRTTDLRGLVVWARKLFPHFAFFSEYAHKQSREGSCFRVLLLRDRDWLRRVEKHHWQLFRELNGHVRLWGVVCSDISEDVRFLTDYCVIGDELVLDYYSESCTLVMTEVADGSPRLSREILKLKQEFDTERDSGSWRMFLPVKVLERAVSKFEKQNK